MFFANLVSVQIFLAFVRFGEGIYLICIVYDMPVWLLSVASMQYLWHLRIKVRKHFHIFELFPVLLTLAIIWGYSYVLTVSGAYDNASPSGQQHCRTDRADAIGSAPW